MHRLLGVTVLATALTPSLTAGEPLPTHKSEELAGLINPLVKAHRGDVSVVIRNLSTGETYEYNADEPRSTASLIKLPILMALYHAVNEGAAQLDQPVKLTRDDKVPGSGVLTPHFSSGIQIPLRDAARLMIAFSDNTATNLVIDAVGEGATNELLDSLGMSETRLYAKVYSYRISDDVERNQKFGLGSTSAGEMVQLLSLLSSGEFVSRERSDQVLEHLRACEDSSKSRRLLPADAKVAHKTGATNQTRTDAGIMETSEGPIAFCILTNNNTDRSWGDENEAELLAAEIGLVAYQHFNGDEATAPSIARTLRLGAQGDLVESLQRTLNARTKPSPSISADGDFGPNTKAAVIAFQKQEKLDATGVVDRGTWKALGPLKLTDDDVIDPAAVNRRTLEKLPLEPIDGPPVVTCKAWAFVDAETGETLATDKGDEIRDPASITKLMTAYVIFKHAEQHGEVFNQTVTFSQRADDTSGSTSEVRAGEKLTVNELLYGLMLPSGNDAAMALAAHFGKQINPQPDQSSYNCFIDAMNNTAKSLGMESTGYKNPHGMTAEGHVTTANDICRLACAAIKLHRLREVVATRQHATTVDSELGYTRNVHWRNTNRLLGIEGYSGIKTGTTGPAGACLVACSEREGHEVIGVVLGSSCSDARYSDIRNLYRWVWSQQTLDNAEGVASDE